MNTLELKGGMIEMIANVNNKQLLQHLYEIMSDIIAQTTNDDTVLSIEQEKQLDKDIEASFVPQNLVEHEEALQKMSRWLNQ